jgi:NAD(P)-dependent dehydrogenase (short-subunit alcohol dehydrogenase family)
MRKIRELMDLSGQVALVTGAAGHIGGAICETLAELGADIVILDLDEARCRECAERIGSEFGVETMSLVEDLSVEGMEARVAEQVTQRWGRLDVLVNCAALVASSELEGWAVPFADQGADAWRLGLEVNLTAAFRVSQGCAKLLADSGGGRIVNISSIYGMVGPDMKLYEGTDMANVASYAASKGGLLQLTRWLATVLAPDIRVNSISVGGVWRNQPESFHSQYIDRTPLRRMAGEEDLKGAAAYLASNLSAYVTGHNLVVDGGWTAW